MPGSLPSAPLVAELWPRPCLAVSFIRPPRFMLCDHSFINVAEMSPSVVGQENNVPGSLP
jgi:hypothetical protein